MAVLEKNPEVWKPQNSEPAVRPVPCNSCGGYTFRSLYSKQSSLDETYQVVQCECGLVQVNPQPNLAAVEPYYHSHYFEKRTDRGYNNYFSDAVRNEINRVYTLNLRDLDFFDFEKEVQSGGKGRSLDAGCAAGYFVDYLKGRGWSSEGIEISKAAAAPGIARGLSISVGDFMKSAPNDSYDLITFWASIEHMHDPASVLKRVSELLRPGGRLILSTCRYGLLARLKGKNWRYMNVPEHLYFFSIPGLVRLATLAGFRLVKSITYGSGMTTRKNASLLFKITKKIMDPLVKLLGQGDMMALHLEKV